MTVIRPNSISGVTSITALANEINVFKHDGVLAGLQLNGVNHHTSAGVSTFHTLNVLGNVSVGGTLTYQDVTNVDSLGIGTFRTGINVSGGQLDVGSNIKLGNAGVITATTFVGNLTGTATQVSLASQSSDTDCYPVFSLDATGNQALYTKSNRLSFNSATGALSATSFVGDGSNLTGITSPAITSIANDATNRVLTTDGDGTATAHSEVKIETVSGNKRLSINRGTGSTEVPLLVRRTDASGIVAEFSNSGGYGVYIGQNGATGEGYIRTATGQPLVFTTNAGSGIANERVRINSSGELWVGTTSGVSNSGYGGISLNGNSGSLLSLMQNGTEYFRLFGDSNPALQFAGVLRLFSGVSGGSNIWSVTPNGTTTGANGVTFNLKSTISHTAAVMAVSSSYNTGDLYIRIDNIYNLSGNAWWTFGLWIMTNQTIGTLSGHHSAMIHCAITGLGSWSSLSANNIQGSIASNVSIDQHGSNFVELKVDVNNSSRGPCTVLCNGGTFDPPRISFH